MPNVNPLFDERDYGLGYQQCLEHIRASLRDYPNGGGDIEVMKEVDRLIKRAQATEKEIQELTTPLTKPANPTKCRSCGRITSLTFGGTVADCEFCRDNPTVRKVKMPESKFTFTHETLLTFMEGIMAMAVEQSRRKNADYASIAGSTNTGLANFYETAKRYGGTPLHALAVHRLKHELSIEKMLRGEELKSEPIMGRIIDAINYNVLALALYIETRQDMELLNKTADEMAAVGVTLGRTTYETP